mgnify:FL=1
MSNEQDIIQTEIQGFNPESSSTTFQDKVWQPVSDRKIRIGIAGYGVCRMGSSFGFQDHPNVEIAAVCDVSAERCAELAIACKCQRTYSSLEEMVKDQSLEAIFLGTDAPNHAQHAILCLNHGKHVACTVPAVFGSLEDADRLYETVKKTGLEYMMFETSAYHAACYAMRVAYESGALGKIIYAEGQYYHYFPTPLASYGKWRTGIPPMWYPTHSTAYYVAVTGQSFTKVSCQGFRGQIPHFQPEANCYKNPFDSEVALFQTSEGGSARMSVCWGMRGSAGETGLVHGELGRMNGTSFSPEEDRPNLPDLSKPPLPPGMDAGGHDGSHGYLTNEFVTALLENRTPLINIALSLNMTVPGIIAHQSALKDGELLTVPQYSWPA